MKNTIKKIIKIIILVFFILLGFKSSSGIEYINHEKYFISRFYWYFIPLSIKKVKK